MLTEQPRKGQLVEWPDSPPEFRGPYQALRVEGDLCWIKREGEEAAPFIWRFRDGLNKLAVIVESPPPKEC